MSTVMLGCLLYNFGLYFGLTAAFGLNVKQRAWIVTASSALVMTCGSAPFVVEYVRVGGDLGQFVLLDSELAKNCW